MVTVEKEGKKTTQLLERKKSKILQYVFELCKLNKQDKKDLMRKAVERDEIRLNSWKR